MVDGEGGAGVVAREQVAHVVRYAGEALEAGLAVEQVGDFRGAHAPLRDQVEDDARVELAGAGAHRQAVERGEAHGAFDAAAFEKRAHRGAAAEMGDDDAAACDFWRDLAQSFGDIFVGEAVEAVAAHALVVERARQGVAVAMRGMPAMEGGIETGDLRQGRVDLHREADRREIVRLVQRRELLVGGQPVEHGRVDQHRARVVGAAVHDAVADGTKLEAVEGPQPCAGLGDGGRQIGHARRRVGAVDQHRSIGGSGAQARPHPDAVNLAAHTALEVGRRQSRRSGTSGWRSRH